MTDPRLQAQINKLISRVDTEEKLGQELKGYIDKYILDQIELWGKFVPQAETAKIIVLDADLVLDDTMPVILAIDPGGASRTVTAPPPSRNSHPFILINLADASEELNVEDVDAASLVDVGQAQQAMILSEGETWISAGFSTGGDMTIGGLTLHGDVKFDGNYHPVYDRGSDVDHRICEVAVDGTPYMMWDESGDCHYTNKYMRIVTTQIGGVRIKVNNYGSGNRYAYIDFIGDDTYSNYGLRLIRHNTGANADSELIHKGTGSLKIITASAASMYFYTNNSVRLGLGTSGDLFPRGTAGTQNLGTASWYWNDVSYKTLTDRGCLGWYEDGVELQDGRIVSDVEALKSIKKHKTLKTVAGAPRLDYSTMPKHVYKPVEIADEDIYEDEHIALDDKDGEPRCKSVRNLMFKKGEKVGEDGAELTALVSIMLGAIKELDSRLLEIEI